ncbi:MAG: hypothetical protein CL920_19585 [Deltaproteobacteria bacterium]|nr:hypothetical protein [Deltaproteobacteria bacterium]
MFFGGRLNNHQGLASKAAIEEDRCEAATKTMIPFLSAARLLQGKKRTKEGSRWSLKQGMRRRHGHRHVDDESHSLWFQLQPQRAFLFPVYFFSCSSLRHIVIAVSLR